MARAADKGSNFGRQRVVRRHRRGQHRRGRAPGGRSRYRTPHSVYVTPAHRGQDGPARALVETATDFARRHTECGRLTLGVREDNHRAMAFYRRIGFHHLSDCTTSRKNQ
ncbi:GNAT family N-acetyltransferase [Streptomyces sp. NPDC055886]